MKQPMYMLDHSQTDPHLLKGRDRIDEIGRLLAIGIRRALARQQLEKQRQSSLAPDKSTPQPECRKALSSLGSRHVSPK